VKDRRNGAPAQRGDSGAGLAGEGADIARMQGYWRGGSAGSETDRRVAQQAMAAYPGLAASVRANRAFLGRSVRFLAAERGVRQFLDVGTGLPAPGGTHEITGQVAPGCRVVYCDNEPDVVQRARMALADDITGGGVDYIEADVRDTGGLLARSGMTLDLSRPVVVLLVSVLHMVSDDDDPHAAAARLMAALPVGSYLVLTHVAADIDADAIAEMTRRVNQQVTRRATPRDRATVLRFFDGLELLPPGLVPASQWRPDSAGEAAAPSAQWSGVGRRE
jgi:S-adenosyl methyltransferase